MLSPGFLLGIQAFHGNPFDGHTLKESLSHAEKLYSRCNGPSCIVIKKTTHRKHFLSVVGDISQNLFLFQHSFFQGFINGLMNWAF